MPVSIQTQQAAARIDSVQVVPEQVHEELGQCSDGAIALDEADEHP